MTSVLFVCTGNQFRSPIAAEVFREKLMQDGRAPQWEVYSAGTWTTNGLRAPQEAIKLAQSFGVNIDRHLTQALNRELLEEADIVLVMQAGHKESIQVEFPFARSKVHLISHVIEGVDFDIPDPAGSRGEARQIISELVEMIRNGAEKIYQLAGS